MKIDVSRVAKLANLPLSPKEKEKFEKQLSEIFNYFEKLKQINTSTIKETSQVTELRNITREDAVKPCFPQKDALLNAKDQYNNLFKIKAILDQ